MFAIIPAAQCSFSLCLAVFLSITAAGAEPKQDAPAQSSASRSADEQTKLDAALTKMLSGATLEGSFTVTDGGKMPDKLRKEKYTLGDVKKIAGDLWQIPARIQYGEKDVTLPIVLPIKWAGDTPMVVVDSLPLPGFGTVSARVMFFADHYAGYWKHGDHGGHLFGVIHPAEKTRSSPATNQP
jgi:hypothetical protein